MPLGIIGQTGPGMRQVVRFGDRSTGRGTFRGEFWARYCNQWGLYGVRVQQRRDAALFPNYFGQTCYLFIICRVSRTDGTRMQKCKERKKEQIQRIQQVHSKPKSHCDA